MQKSNALSPARNPNLYKEYVSAVPPDGGWGWVIVFITFIICYIIDGILMSYGKLISAIMSELKISKPNVALIGAIQTSVYYFMGPLAAATVNQAGFRIVCVFGAIVAVTGLVLASFIQTHIGFICGYAILGGMGFGMIISSSSMCAGHYFNRYRAVTSGIVSSASGIGVMSLSQAFTYVLNWKGLYVTLQFEALLVVVAAILSLFLRPLKPIRLKIQDKHVTSRRFSYVVISHEESDPDIAMPKAAQIRVFDDRDAKRPTTIWGKCYHGVCPCLGRASDDSDDEILAGHRPLYREDIYFQSSLAAARRLDANIDHDNVFLTTKEFMATEGDVRKVTFSERIFPRAIAHALGILFDISLFKSPIFVCIWFGSVFTTLGAFTTVAYIYENAINHGYEKEVAGWFLSTIGLCNTIGRLTSGLTLFCPTSFEMAYFVGALLMFVGTLTILSGFYFGSIEIYFVFLFCALFGMTLALFSALRSVVCVANLGMQNLTNCSGYIGIAHGIGSFMGLPISGVLYEYTGSIDWSFAFSGIALITAGLCFMPVPALRRVAKGKIRRVVMIQ